VRRAAALLLLCAAAPLAACGADDSETDDAGAPTNDGETSLKISVDTDADGPGEPFEATLECPGAGTSQVACAEIAKLPDDPAAPVPADQPCTEIYGGPDVMTITGTLDGEEIDATFTRANGCEIERYDRFLPVIQALFDGYRPGEELR
jgi:hypothetical protein